MRSFFLPLSQRNINLLQLPLSWFHFSDLLLPNIAKEFFGISYVRSWKIWVDTDTWLYIRAYFNWIDVIFPVLIKSPKGLQFLFTIFSHFCYLISTLYSSCMVGIFWWLTIWVIRTIWIIIIDRLCHSDSQLRLFSQHRNFVRQTPSDWNFRSAREPRAS